MARAETKADLIKSANENYQKLQKMIDGLTEQELSTTFDFSSDLKKKEKHWQRDQNLRDILTHLYEWNHLFILWVNGNIKGSNRSFLPEPYNWKNYGDMNIELFKKHQNTSLEDAKRLLDESHHQIMSLIERFTNEQLFTKNYYEWANTTSIGSYCVSCTASHYDWAMKKLRAHKKRIKII